MVNLENRYSDIDTDEMYEVGIYEKDDEYIVYVINNGNMSDIEFSDKSVFDILKEAKDCFLEMNDKIMEVVNKKIEEKK